MTLESGEDMSDLLEHVTELSPEKRKLVELLLQKETQVRKGTRAALAQPEAQRPASAAPIAAIPRDGRPLPLSLAQQRLWFLDQLAPGDPFYNIASATRMIGRLDPTRLQRAFNAILRRHEVLRTTFAQQDSAENMLPVLVIASDLTLELPIIDLTSLAPTEREECAQELMREEAARPFDLARGPLIRTALLRLSEQEHILLATMHHIIADGWSTGVLMRELGTLYAAFVRGQPSPLPELPIQYADFAAWQRQRLQGGNAGESSVHAQLNYWRRSLAGLPVLNLPTDRPRSAAQSFTFRGASHTFTLPVSLSADLKALSQREGATLFMTLLAAFQLLLARYSRQDDIVVGTPIAGRRHDELEQLIGFFNNMLVLRTDLSGSSTFYELARRARETALGAYAHQDVPFEQLVEEIQAPRDPSRTPLFQVMFALQNVPLPTQELPGLSLQPLATDSQAAKFDLNLALKDTAQGLDGVLRYNADLFDAATIRRMLDHFEALLEAIVANPSRPLADLLPLSATDQQWIDEHLHMGEASTGPREFIAPRTAVETVLADIWANVLSVERVGVTDNFFDLGGHSLKAAQLFSRVRETFRVNLPLRSLFEATTVDSLARIIVAHEARPGQTEKIAQILMRIRGMSAEERQTSLGRKERTNG